MNFNDRQSVIDQAGGNSMAWMADREEEAPGRCECCGEILKDGENKECKKCREI